MKTKLVLLSFILCASAPAPVLSGAEGREAQSAEPALSDDFDRAELGEGWRVNTGAWTITDGVLHAAEIPSENHSAAARRAIETQDATYQLKFRLTGEAKAFHFGFDPAPGELDKKGHLFSVIVTPTQWSIMKHIDKAKPAEDPNETLAESNNTFTPGTWYSLKVTTKDTKVTATIEDVGTLTAEHPTFTVKKPTLVFRALGDGVDLDDIVVSGS